MEIGDIRYGTVLGMIIKDERLTIWVLVTNRTALNCIRTGCPTTGRAPKTGVLRGAVLMPASILN